jgi:hypothetical protein
MFLAPEDEPYIGYKHVGQHLIKIVLNNIILCTFVCITYIYITRGFVKLCARNSE